MASVGDNIRAGGAKGLPRSLAKLIENIDAEIAAAGAAPKAYLSAGMNVQTLNIDANDHVEFDSVLEDDGSGSIALSTGGGNQTDGIFTLAANKTYKLTAAVGVNITTTVGFARCQWRNNTSNLFIGIMLGVFSADSQFTRASQPLAVAIIEVGGSPIPVELRIVGEEALGQIDGGGGQGGSSPHSFALVEEIG